ncbi:uncharacterized protein SRS1_15088 [Sporisorium reilianum f. sp. reilianum]|uniref:Velvet domain-containing protein n=1 Tax=Sporisorium reilianum f. sp. reilianum TaxID=72559 RepID=A0A2N8UHK7_9BASI|nr:uncharacterized protein SRS1_15088 [Sporisorium reilianum f. sp. reilianum]
MSIPNKDAPPDRRSETPTQRVETSSSRRDAHDDHRPDTSRYASDAHPADGSNMRPPSHPPSTRFASASQSSAQTQLPSIAHLTRLAPERMQASECDSQQSSHPSGSSSAAYPPRIQESYASSSSRGESGSAADRRDRDTTRAAPPPPPASRNNRGGGVRLHDLRTAASAPPPMLPDLPRHSTQNRTYQLIIRQQPQQGRLCGLGSKDKRPLDPLPILQLRILKPDGSEDEDAENSPDLILQVTLRKEDPFSGTHSDAMLVESNDALYPFMRMLEGRLVASANVARDLDGSRACFFVFTDLSIRQEGRFRLAFKLLALGPPSLAHASAGGHVLAEALTQPFTIYSPRRFPGMTESTELAKCLARQGIQVPVRNDIRRRQEMPDSLHAMADDRGLE